jgi:hypothetical protein
MTCLSLSEAYNTTYIISKRIHLSVLVLDDLLLPLSRAFRNAV